MAQLKDVQLKISAVKKTKQITKAMNMVAASKLRGAQTNMEGFRPYAAKFAEVLGSLAEKAGDEASPLLTPREEVKAINIILCTSDRGLCGGFNANLINKAKSFAKEQEAKGVEITFTNFGKKGRDWARKQGYKIASEHLGIVGSRFGFNIASISGGTLIEGFLNGIYDEVYVIFSEFYSVARQILF
jgi:F-type H+-transporting ATPase subunit gamma